MKLGRFAVVSTISVALVALGAVLRERPAAAQAAAKVVTVQRGERRQVMNP